MCLICILLSLLSPDLNLTILRFNGTENNSVKYKPSAPVNSCTWLESDYEFISSLRHVGGASDTTGDMKRVMPELSYIECDVYTPLCSLKLKYRWRYSFAPVWLSVCACTCACVYVCLHACGHVAQAAHACQIVRPIVWTRYKQMSFIFSIIMCFSDCSAFCKMY